MELFLPGRFFDSSIFLPWLDSDLSELLSRLAMTTLLSILSLRLISRFRRFAEALLVLRLLVFSISFAFFLLLRTLLQMAVTLEKSTRHCLIRN